MLGFFNPKPPKTIRQLNDFELLLLVANYEDWSEEKTFHTAKSIVGSFQTYDNFFATKKLDADIRTELRRALAINIKKFGKFYIV